LDRRAMRRVGPGAVAGQHHPRAERPHALLRGSERHVRVRCVAHAIELNRRDGRWVVGVEPSPCIDQAEDAPMAAQSVSGASPITFVSEDTSNAGIQYQIPLPLISYDSTTTPAVTVSAWPSGISGTDQTLAEKVIQNLINQGF